MVRPIGFTRRTCRRSSMKRSRHTLRSTCEARRTRRRSKNEFCDKWPGELRSQKERGQMSAPVPSLPASLRHRSRCDLLESIADAADGFDQVGVAQLATQGLDVNVDGPFEHDAAFAGRGIHQLLAREGAAGLLQKTFEQAEFGGS